MAVVCKGKCVGEASSTGVSYKKFSHKCPECEISYNAGDNSFCYCCKHKLRTKSKNKHRDEKRKMMKLQQMEGITNGS